MKANVMDAEQVVQLYERMSELTGRMLDAARDGDWDALTALEQSGRVLVRDLMECDAVAPTPPELRERKAHLIRKVLADDAQIRELAEPQLARLARLLASDAQARKLRTTYEPG